ncbi:Gfo/Idh/MocA family oxidoreductase [Sanguibacter sp. YZGR15]|uniref:Gfo/Idh/MocA family oxidoreductase n=2 Tax=Sanguibacter suaedae TaxID=2795737 RepID=A0A934IBK1_9MICO|nr:Gfo/Idh/MocA family oxidoreductase [Sanguibacter suaedae]
MMRRYAVIGTGHRAQMYVDSMLADHADVAEIVAWCEPNPVRTDYFDDLVRASGRTSVPVRYAPDQIEQMVAERLVDAVIVTSPDHTHAEVATRAMRAGADVIIEKPLTTDLAGSRHFIEALEDTGRSLVLTFNYRYAPRNAALKDVVASGEIGEVTSVHFEWLLDTMHGSDYFRRWHRERDRSGGLLVHNASHHFDLVNWWLDDFPSRVFASGGLRFYGDENARARGLGKRPERGTTTPPSHDPFALDLRDDPRLKALYLDAEHHDGYLRDRDPFAPGITIEDNMSVLVDYTRGASLTYSLNTHSPWEGYRVGINGTEGRVELDVVERGSLLPRPDGRRDLDASKTGHVDAPGELRPRSQRILVQRHWEASREVEITGGEGAHGGGDAQMLADLFRGPAPDPLGRPAGYKDGLRSVVVGIAATSSLHIGLPVRIDDLGLDLA